jgi:anti-sigma regulatory factor (Ser/Thr protein kinase)
MADKNNNSYCPQTGIYSILKKDISKQASEAGFSQKKLEELEIIVTEMTSRIYKLSLLPEVRMCIAEEKNRKYLELICIDSAPEIASTAKVIISDASAELHSTKGLDCIKRLSDYFEVFKMSGWGTMLICRIYKNSEQDK